MTPSTFAIVTRDEIWACGSKRTLVQTRLSHGVATTRDREIRARDECDGLLLARAESEMTRARAALSSFGEARVRIVAAARRVHEVTSSSASLSIAVAGLSLVSTPEDAQRDYEWLVGAEAAGERKVPLPTYRRIPILWRNGSGAVLLHEAIGHASEHGHFSEWPRWLSVRDEPQDAVDDTGAPAMDADLVAEPPRCFRRDTFTDIPLRRMTNVFVRQIGAPFELQDPRIEVELLAGGRYEPLDQSITLHVTAARLIDGGSTRRLAPFTISESRQAVTRALAGAAGASERYPGVVCSKEGQEVLVGSHAPELLTLF